MVSEGGVPSRSVMRSNWCTTFFPGNNGFPVSISANMHPMLQISIAGVYCKRQTYKITQVHQYYFSIVSYTNSNLCKRIMKKQLKQNDMCI